MSDAKAKAAAAPQCAIPDMRRRRLPSRSRYDLRDATAHYGLARPAGSSNVQPVTVAVPDPHDADVRIRATANRRVDILELERSHGRISEAAYMVGRIVQATFERASGVRSGGGGAGVRVDAATAHELAIIYSIDNARAVQALMKRIESAIGTVGARFLRQVITEGVSFAGAAEQRGRGGRAGTAAAADRFRMLLEDLAEAWRAIGGQQQ